MATANLRPTREQPVKALLAEVGITQHEVSRRSGEPVHNVNKTVNGRRPPSLRVVEALEDALGRPVSELFDEDLYARCHWRLREVRTGSRRPGGDAA